MVGEPQPWDAATLLDGKYQVIEELKTGGTARIDLAILRGGNNFTREVVLKRPLPHLMADHDLRAMFLDEAHLASRFSHPNVVQVIDLVVRDGLVMLVLEYLPGRDLREVIRRANELGQRIPPELSAYVIAEAAAGLGYTHDVRSPDGQPLHLVHRDVSPKNIRLTDAGAVKVIDFGIARAEIRQSETAPGSVKGTLGYMSPEQVLGDAVDRRSDVFSLGICLYQMLTGRNPFDGATLKERVQRLIQQPIPDPSALAPGVDPRLDAITQRALERDLERRYPSMAALCEDLEEFLADQRRASPRQRLVAYLESLFPDLHQLPPRLQEALSSSSSLSAGGGQLVRDVAREAQLSAPTLEAAPISPLAATGALPLDPTTEPAPIAAPVGITELAATPPRPTPRAAPWAIAAIAAAIGLGAGLWLWSRPPPAPVVAAVEAPSPSPRLSPPPEPVASAVAEPTPPAPSPTPSPTASAAPPRAPSPAARGSRPTPQALLRAGARRAAAGELDDALLLYRLAYSRSRGHPDPSILKNLGLLHRQRGEVAKLRACLNLYLSEGGRSDAAAIRALLAGFPATPSTPCVAPGEAAEAEAIASRAGARIEAWTRE